MKVYLQYNDPALKRRENFKFDNKLEAFSENTTSSERTLKRFSEPARSFYRRFLETRFPFLLKTEQPGNGYNGQKRAVFERPLRVPSA